jgi:hypothetical protein
MVKKPTLDVLSTCRQIYNEARALPVPLTTFVLRNDYFGGDYLDAYINSKREPTDITSIAFI